MTPHKPRGPHRRMPMKEVMELTEAFADALEALAAGDEQLHELVFTIAMTALEMRGDHLFGTDVTDPEPKR